MGDRAACGIPCGVYMTASAASPLDADEKLDSRPSPLMDRLERGFRGVLVRKGCVAKVIRSAEW